MKPNNFIAYLIEDHKTTKYGFLRRRRRSASEHAQLHPQPRQAVCYLRAKGDLGAAEPLSREALEARRITLGNRHLSTLSSVNNLGRLLKDKGDLAAAEPLLRE